MANLESSSPMEEIERVLETPRREANSEKPTPQVIERSRITYAAFSFPSSLEALDANGVGVNAC